MGIEFIGGVIGGVVVGLVVGFLAGWYCWDQAEERSIRRMEKQVNDDQKKLNDMLEELSAAIKRKKNDGNNSVVRSQLQEVRREDIKLYWSQN